MNPAPEFGADLFHRYDLPGPGYTSHPTAFQFDESFDEQRFRRHIERTSAQFARDREMLFRKRLRWR